MPVEHVLITTVFCAERVVSTIHSGFSGGDSVRSFLRVTSVDHVGK